MYEHHEWTTIATAKARRTRTTKRTKRRRRKKEKTKNKTNKKKNKSNNKNSKKNKKKKQKQKQEPRKTHSGEHFVAPVCGGFKLNTTHKKLDPKGLTWSVTIRQESF